MPDKSRFRKGSIVRIKLKNFLTYSNVEFFPGPNMNMVIGPNGTGKSTVVCAIAIGLAGSPSILGRHKELKDFVKRGEDKAVVEIELQGNSDNVVIRRSFKKAGNQSTWRINAETATERAVRDIIKEYNIQVDNLCQFLPQDKVASFAQLTPHQLLKETERAVGGDALVALHDKMIEKRRVEVEFAQDVSTKRDEVEKLEAQNRLIERDVQRFQERETLQDNIKAVHLRMAQMSYDKDREEYLALKELKKDLQEKYEKIIHEKQPMLKRLEKMKRELTLKEQARMKAKASVDDAQKKIHDVKQKMNSLDGKIQASEDHKNALKKRQKERNEKLARLEKDVKVIARIVEEKELELQQIGLMDSEGQYLDIPVGPYAEIDQEIQKIAQQTNRFTEQIQECMQNKSSYVAESNNIVSKIKQTEQRLKKLDDIRQRKLAALRSKKQNSVRGDQVMQALEWIDQNRGRFTDRVFEPVCLELNIRDPKYASYVECFTSNAILTTFLVKNSHDYDLLCDELITRRNLKINVAVVSSKSLADYRSGLSREEIQALGFEGFLIDFLEGPEEVLAFMCDRSYLHLIPISLQPIPSVTAVEERHEIRSFISGQDRHVVKRAYGGVSTSISSVRNAQFLNLSLDTEAKERYEAELSELNEALRKVESEVAKIEAIENGARKKYEVLRERKGELGDQKRAMGKVRKEHSERKQGLISAQSKLEIALDSEDNTEKELENVDLKLKETEVAHTSACLNLVKVQTGAVNRFRDLVRATLAFSQTKMDVYRFENEINQSDYRAADALNALEDANREMKTSKQAARTSLEALKELQTQSTESIINLAIELQGQTIEQLQASVARDKARIEMIMAIDPSIVDEFKAREKKIAELKTYLDHVDEKLEAHRAEMEATKKIWKEQLDQMISRVSGSFSRAFQSIGCAGDAILVEHEEYDQWSIEIQVKFRDTEKLQKLSGTRQSGGERSVSTILYLLALQDLSLSPFRVVDEINQGMDPRNERMVHRLILDAACGRDSCQYFLITPKLLPNLDYHENMKILCVMNGIYQPERLNWREFLPSHRAPNAIAAV